MYAVVAGWKQSGQSQQVYCASQELSMAVFQYWLRHWRDSQHEGSSGQFVEVQPSINTRGLIIEYPSGIKVHLAPGYSQGELECLLKVVQG